MTTAEIESLLERVRAATGPDQQLDADIFTALRPFQTTEEYKAAYDRGDIDAYWYWMSPFKYTASIDACLALIERVLPGWAWKVGTCCVSDDVWLVPDFNSPVHGERLKKQFGYDTMKVGTIWDVGIDVDRRPSGHPQIALLEALLLSLLHQASDKGMIDAE